MECIPLLYTFPSAKKVILRNINTENDQGAGHGRDRMQSVPTTTKAVSSNPAHVGVYSIQHYVIKDLRQVGDL